MGTQENTLEEIVKARIAALHEIAPDSIGDLMGFELLSCDAAAGEYKMRCKTQEWMRNSAGTLHGGMCAAVLDQAMGFLAYCVKPGEGQAPTVQLQVSYHRPLIPGEDVAIRVKVESVTRSLMHLRSEASLASSPDRICISASAIYFYKPNK